MNIFDIIYYGLSEENAFENIDIRTLEDKLSDKYIDFSNDEACNSFGGYLNAVQRQAFKVGLKTAFSLMFDSN